MQGLIRTDSVLINNERYTLADGVVQRRTIFPEQNYQVMKGFNAPDYSDLSPAVFNYEIPDFSKGSGQWIDNGNGFGDSAFSRKAWFSTLEHSLEDVMVIAQRRNAAGAVPYPNFAIHYRNNAYLLTLGGLYVFDNPSSTFTLVGGSPVIDMQHACIHRGYLVIACGSSTGIRFYDGTAFTVPSGQTAMKVADIGGTLHAVEAQNVNGTIRVRYSENAGATWSPALSKAGAEDALPSASDPRGVCVAPDSTGTPQLYVSTTSAVFMVDYRVGMFALLHDMSHNVQSTNGYVLAFWPSTRKIYVNERSTLIAIDPGTGEAEVVGPEVSTMPPVGLPSGIAAGFKGTPRTFSFNPNWFFIGTQPNGASDFSVIMKMSPNHHWYYVNRHYTENMPTQAMLLNGNFGYRLYYVEQSGAIWQARFLNFGSDDYAEEGELYTPWLAFGLPGVDKCLYEIIVEADGLSATDTITIGYRTNYNEVVGFTNFTVLNGTDPTPYRRVFGTAPAIGVEARSVQFDIKLNRDPADATSTPRFLRMRVRWRPVPPIVDVYDMTLRFDDEADPYARLVDLATTLRAAYTDNCVVQLKVSGDSDETALLCIPLADAKVQDFEQRRDSTTLKLSLMTVTTAVSGSGTQVSGHVHVRNSFVGTGGQTIFTLGNTPLAAPIVFVADAYQVESVDYTRSGAVITFTAAPALNANIRVHYPYSV